MPYDYLKGDLSPLQTRVLFLYDQIPDKLYCCVLANIYMSSKLTNLALKRNIYVHSFNCKGGHDIPSSVSQEEIKSRQAQIGVHGTVKAAIICGYPECKIFLLCQCMTQSQYLLWIQLVRLLNGLIRSGWFTQKIWGKVFLSSSCASTSTTITT